LGRSWCTSTAQLSEKDFPEYGVGSVVTLTLDLTDAGELSASADDDPNHVIFSQVFEAGDDEGLSFVPAVGMRLSGSVRFKGFDPSSYF